MKENFQHSRKPSNRWVCGAFWNLRGQRSQEWGEKKNTPQNMCLSATASREVAQTLASVTNERGLNREAGAGHRCLG